MARSPWQQLLADTAWPQGEGSYPIAAYSEYMPPPRLGRLPYGTERAGPALDEGDSGWPITEHEEAFELRPGLDQVARQVVTCVMRLGRGDRTHGVGKSLRSDNPYWTDRLAGAVGHLPQERYVALMPLALTRTQDDKGRIRWTLLGASELGPADGFWQSFFGPGGRERPAEEILGFFGRLLTSLGTPAGGTVDELRRAGLRILPQGPLPTPLPSWTEGPLPRCCEALLLGEDERPEGVQYVLTFRPFGSLPDAVQRGYLEGRLQLLPFPGSLVFWGVPLYLRLRQELPSAIQIPLLSHVERHAGAGGLRVPQSGWMHEPDPDAEAPTELHAPLRNTFQRTHRFARVPRDAPPEQAVSPREDRVAHVLFDAAEATGLYGKPMARNAQIWTADGRLLLDGPTAARPQIEHAARVVAAGGVFGYRFYFPPMRVGTHEILWHRPLVAFVPAGTDRPVVVDDAPLGRLGARPVNQDSGPELELWPQPWAREPYVLANTLFRHTVDPRPHQTARNCRKLLDAPALFGEPQIDPALARRLLTLPEHQTLEEWLDALPGRASDLDSGKRLVNVLRRNLAPAAASSSDTSSLTYRHTALRAFELAFWRAIATLSDGLFANRNNADCARDPVTQHALRHPGRDLERMGDYLLKRHRRAIARTGMVGRALAGELPFRWQTDFAFTWSDGWRCNQRKPCERDLIVIIPGRDRSRAVILADHYDTAYMEDVYGENTTRDGPRLAAPGADDNSSATATLLLAAPVFLELSRAGRLGCDVWLVHLTGEEFPADCLGSRHLAQVLVERTLKARHPGGRKKVDLSGTRVEGVVIMDMIAHDNPHRRGVFQIAPGDSRESFRLARHAHEANEAWNAGTAVWNRRPGRQARPVRRRWSDSGALLPPPRTARHPRLHGEIRPHDDPASTLYNTDGQIFSDAGIPTILLMEDYDIDRSGYHDSRDTLAGIDLDFGAALAAIAIETVARAAAADGR